LHALADQNSVRGVLVANEKSRRDRFEMVLEFALAR
jgi:hypothetical protein